MSRLSKTSKTKKLPASKEGESENICFTIMPFGGWFDTYYENIYRPAIEAAGLVPRRADDLYRPSAIVHDIWALTKTAKIILADLTGKNPNVFYELGLAHAIAQPAILVTQTMDDVPFDLQALRVIVYDRNQPDWGANLKDSIAASIKEILTSPAKSVLPSFLQIDDSHKLSVTATEKELISLRQDVDLLMRERVQLQNERMIELLSQIPKETEFIRRERKEFQRKVENKISGTMPLSEGTGVFVTGGGIQLPKKLRTEAENQSSSTDALSEVKTA